MSDDSVFYDTAELLAGITVPTILGLFPQSHITTLTGERPNVARFLAETALMAHRAGISTLIVGRPVGETAGSLIWRAQKYGHLTRDHVTVADAYTVKDFRYIAGLHPGVKLVIIEDLPALTPRNNYWNSNSTYAHQHIRATLTPWNDTTIIVGHGGTDVLKAWKTGHITTEHVTWTDL